MGEAATTHETCTDHRLPIEQSLASFNIAESSPSAHDLNHISCDFSARFAAFCSASRQPARNLSETHRCMGRIPHSAVVGSPEIAPNGSQ